MEVVSVGPDREQTIFAATSAWARLAGGKGLGTTGEGEGRGRAENDSGFSLRSHGNAQWWIEPSFRRFGSRRLFSSPLAPRPSPLMSKLPRHIAVIMDGNGRWAQRQGLPRIEGHRRGVATSAASPRNARDLASSN